VTTWNENEGLPRCGYPIKYRDDGCQLLAGRGTDHKGIGRCLWHDRQDPLTRDRAVRDTREAYAEVLRRQEVLRRAIDEYGEDSLVIEGSPTFRARKEYDAARKRMVRLANAALRFGLTDEEVAS
jgi:hypothetical protein